MKSSSLLFFLFFGFSLLAQYSDATQRAIDSLKNVAENHEDDSVRIVAYRAWDEYIYIADPELDFELNEIIIEICDRNVKSSGLSQKRKFFFYRNKASSVNILGLVLTDQGNHEVAHDYFEESLELASILQDSSVMASATNNLGMIYKVQGFPDLALKYYEQSMLLDGESNDRSKATYYNNIGLCYTDMKKHEVALNYYRMSLFLARKVGDLYVETNVLGNIGEIHYVDGNLDSAIYYYEASYNISSETGHNTGQVYAYERIGMAYFQLKDYNRAIQYCTEALSWIPEEGHLYNENRCHKCLYLSYKSKNNLSKALYHHEQHKILQDSLLSQKNVETAAQEEYKKEYEKKRLADSLEISNQQRIKEVKLQADIDKGENQKFYLFIGLGALGLIIILIFRSYQSKKKDNEIISHQKQEVEQKNQEILDSIQYAKRIQTAILPPDDLVKKILPDSFIFYKPKDIVAGDFFWLEEVDNRIFLAVADCTGHGVPGAMVSVVCHNALNRSVREFKLKSPGEILDKTRELVIETFAKSKENVKDGMDISLMCWNKGDKTVEYAGANNPIYIIRDNNGSPKLEELKADKQPIGAVDTLKNFNTKEFVLNNRDIIYAFTDGFADQFGGPRGKKYKYKQLKDKCLNLYSSPMQEQKEIFEKEFEAWRGQLDQIDDVCILGLSLN